MASCVIVAAMKSHFFAFVALGSIALASGVSAQTNSLQTLKAQSQVVVRTLQNADLWVGGAVGIISGDSSDLSYYGTTSVAGTSAPDDNSRFEIGSASKSFTGIMIAKLVVDDPTISLDDNVSKFIPELTGTFTGKITLRQLGTHTSGLPVTPCYGDQDTSPSNCLVGSYAHYTAEQLLAYLKVYNRPDAGPYKYLYSNTGTTILGYILTRVKNQTFDQILKDEITTPLQMTNTLVNHPENEATIPNFIPGYDVALIQEPHWQWDVFAPAGGIVSTAPDMMKYLAANLYPPTTPLGKAIKLSQTTGMCWDNWNNPIGTGIVWKNGGTGGFASVLVFKPAVDPTQSIGMFVSGNLMADIFTDTVGFNPIAGIKLPDLMGFSIGGTALGSFIGKYTDPTSPTDSITITKPKDFLEFSASFGFKWRLQATSSLDFDSYDGLGPIGAQKVSFQKDANGNITGLTMHYDPGNGTRIDIFFKKVQ